MGAGAFGWRRRDEPCHRRACAWLCGELITEWYAYDRGVLDALGVAPNEKIAGFVHIGRVKEKPDDRPRPPLGDIVTWFGS